ncbi:MAG: ABC transporter substrate-binding protein [Mycobacterium sp.]
MNISLPWVIRRIAVMACAGLVVSGCSGSSVESASSGDTFVYAGSSDFIQEWDPATFYNNEDVVLDNIYETLTTYNGETGKIDPLLATRWSSTPDALTWTFELRPGVKFHSGRELDSTAVKESIERTKEIGRAASYEWDAVESIDTPNPHQVVFHLSEPVPLDVHAASGFSAHIYDVTAHDGDLATWFSEGHDAGTGPYTVTSFDKGGETEVTLARFDDYWAGWEDGQFDKVRYKKVPTETTAYQLLRSGEVDFVKEVSAPLFKEASADPDQVQAIANSSYQNQYISLNTQQGPFQDVRVRQAVFSALDAAELQKVLGEAAVPASGLVPEGLFGYQPGLELKKDLDRSRRLLAEAGYGPGGTPLTLTLLGNPSEPFDSAVATLLNSSLSELGVKLDSSFLETAALTEKSRSTGRRPDITLNSWWTIYPDASSWYIDLVRSSDEIVYNYSGLRDPEIDAEIDRIPALSATDPDALGAVYATLAQQVTVDQAAVAATVVKRPLRLLAPSIRGYVDNPAYANVAFVHQLRRA